MFLGYLTYFFIGLVISLLATLDQIAASRFRIVLTTLFTTALIFLSNTIIIDLIQVSDWTRFVYAIGAGIGSGVGVFVFKFANRYLTSDQAHEQDPLTDSDHN